MSRLFAVLTLFACLLAPAATAQLRFETIELRSGRRVTGDVVDVTADSIVLTRRVGKGGVREVLPFTAIEPGSLYAVLLSALSPLDLDSNRRIADIAFDAGLFTTARRHYLASLPADSAPIGDLADRILLCESKDIENLLARADVELDKENFEASRRLASLVMRRYADRDEAKAIPERLDEINRRYEAAHRRDLALERSRKERSLYEKAEKYLADLETGLADVEGQERLALRSSDRFRSSLDRFERALRALVKVEKKALEVRESGLLPTDLRARLGQAEERVITMHIRLRLHVASLYTVRGSFGSALAWTNEALAYDPTDAQALDTRGRIEQAAAAASARIISRQR